MTCVDTFCSREKRPPGETAAQNHHETRTWDLLDAACCSMLLPLFCSWCACVCVHVDASSAARVLLDFCVLRSVVRRCLSAFFV
jgi:hypothetical protein